MRLSSKDGETAPSAAASLESNSRALTPSPRHPSQQLGDGTFSRLIHWIYGPNDPETSQVGVKNSRSSLGMQPGRMTPPEGDSHGDDDSSQTDSVTHPGRRGGPSDSSKKSNAQFLGGNITFIAEEAEEFNEMISRYLLIIDDSSEQVEKLTSDMTRVWGFRRPNLVLSIISSAHHFKPWKREEDVEDFMDGLMQAASLTDMWILTDGKQGALSSIIGQAVARERSRRNILETEQTLVRFFSREQLPELTVIGVVPGSSLPSNLFNDLLMAVACRDPVVLKVDDGENGASKELNPYMTHFLLMTEEMTTTAIANFVLKLEMRFKRSIGPERNYSASDTVDSGGEPMSSKPLIGLLIQGGPEDIDHVLALLRKNVPVIVVGGQGKAAGLLAFAYRAAQETYGTDSYEQYVKTELLNRLSETFPDEFRDNSLSRNQYRDKILQCVTYATQGDSALLTLVEKNTNFELKDLSKVILTAVLTSFSTTGIIRDQEELQSNMQLIIDWIQPELAVTEIFEKYSIDKFEIDEDQFEQVLLRPGREKFVELFLDRGFLLHKYLNHRRLEMLFERCVDKDFFVSICVERVLGERVTLQQPITENFVSSIDCPLNHLLHVLTGLRKLINPLQLSINASNDRVESAVIAEQRALHAMLYWAALTNNTKLTEIFWCRTNEPMAVALVLSTMYSRLSKHWISDRDLKLKMENVGRDFGKHAVEMLDLAYQESADQALASLTKKLDDFKRYTAVDLALIGRNKYFIAHPCCQKHVSNTWYGNVRISQRSYSYIPLSDNMKVCLCCLLIFPTYFWIEIASDHERPTAVNRKALCKKYGMANSTQQMSLRFQLVVLRTFTKVLIARKLFYLWSAPITKFWVSQIFYVLFLILFVKALATPFCGNPQLDLVVIVWLIGFLVDQLYIVAAKKMHCTELAIGSNIRTIIAVSYTLTIMVWFRFLHPQELPYATVKILLSFSLIFFCYYAMGFFFPVSPVFGPMLVNITVMMKQDLIIWLKMWSMTFISGAISIHAVVYPAFPLGWPAFYKAIRRGIFALFMTDIEDVRSNDPCNCLYNYSTQFGCQASEIPGTVRERLETCPYHSLGSYLVVLQYIFSTKLVYNTLIFAVTSVTLSSTYEKSVEIWKYQFFRLVLNNQRRPFLPAPLVLCVYPFILLFWLYKAIRYFCKACSPCCVRTKSKPIPSHDYYMWRSLMRLHKRLEKLKQEKLNLAKDAEERLTKISKDQLNQGKQLNSLNDRLFGVINSQTTISLTLEQMQHVMAEMGNKHFHVGEALISRLPHSKCRKSPYPATSIRRYPVFDKNVSWEESYPTYDPPAYSKPLEEYDEDRRPYIDPDMFDLMRQREEVNLLDKVSPVAHVLLQFDPSFNQEVEATTATWDKQVVDRTSWITKDDQPLLYTVDSNNIPRNPMGRTGLRGRGNLWRWGPNHMIYAIVSRWKSIYNFSDMIQGPKIVNGKKVMEILVVLNESTNEDSLPGDFISGRMSKYNVICEVFMRDLLGEKEVPSTTQLDQDDMTQFFRQFVSSDFILSGILGRTVPGTSSLTSNLIYRGYMDDSNNTDNAWVEAEIWSFHFNNKDKLDKKILQRDKYWREVSSVMNLAGNQQNFVLEVARMYDDGTT